MKSDREKTQKYPLAHHSSKYSFLMSIENHILDKMAQVPSKHSLCSYEDESLSDVSSPEGEKAIPFLRYVLLIGVFVVRKMKQ